MKKETFLESICIFLYINKSGQSKDKNCNERYDLLINFRDSYSLLRYKLIKYNNLHFYPVGKNVANDISDSANIKKILVSRNCENRNMIHYL